MLKKEKKAEYWTVLVFSKTQRLPWSSAQRFEITDSKVVSQVEKLQLHTQIQVSLTIRHKTPQQCICRKVFQNCYSVLLSALWVLWHHLESTVAAVLATGCGQSEVLTSHCQVMVHTFSNTTEPSLWWNGYSVVRPHHQVHYLSVSDELNELNLRNNKKDYCQLLYIKK